MYCKLALATLAVIIGSDFASAQQIPSTTTAAEMWNPWTWFWPYAIASAEGYRDYYQKAQKATNELYQQIYKTNAFPWVTGNWGAPQTQPSQNGGQSNQEGQNSGGSGGQSDQNTTNGTGQNTGEQTNEAGQNTGEQTNPTQNETDPQNPPQGDNTQPEENKTETEGTGAQVEGNVQDDGTADATVKPN